VLPTFRWDMLPLYSGWKLVGFGNFSRSTGPVDPDRAPGPTLPLVGVGPKPVYKRTLRIGGGARGSVIGCGTVLQAGKSPVLVPDEADFFNLPNPSSRTMVLGSTQPITEMSTLPPSVSQMSENVGASTSRNPKSLHGMNRDNLTLPYLLT
jgi:hypothetical protein